MDVLTLEGHLANPYGTLDALSLFACTLQDVVLMGTDLR
jgi:hypothetical protein